MTAEGWDLDDLSPRYLAGMAGATPTTVLVLVVWMLGNREVEKGSPKFYKDGYTDILGTFNYATINAKQTLLTSDSRLAVLVVTKDSGALVREVPAPPNVQPNVPNQQSDLPVAVPFSNGSDSSHNEE